MSADSPVIDTAEGLWRSRRVVDASEADVVAALRAAALEEDERLVAQLRVVLATHLIARADNTGARRALEAAHGELSALDDDRWLARCLDRRCIVEFHEGAYGPAMKAGLGAAGAARRAGDPETEAISLANVGRLHRLVGDPDRSMLALRRSLRLATEIPLPELRAHLLAELADLLADRGDFGEAARHLDEAESLVPRDTVTMETIAVALARSRLALDSGRIGVAEAAAEKALDGARSFDDHLWVGTALRQRAEVAAAHGDADAVARFELAVETLRRHGYVEQLAKALLGLARAQAAAGDHGQAIVTLNQAATANRHQPDVGAKAHELLAEVYESMGDAGRALLHLRRSIALDEEHRRAESERRMDALRVHLEVEETERAAEAARARSAELAEALEEVRRVNRLLAESNDERQALIEQLHRLADEDSLTGLANRRQFERRLAEEVVRCRRTRRPLAVAMVDVDRFKGVNDRFTHSVGDAVLGIIGELLRCAVRDTDVAARWGGEEFALVLPGADRTAALAICERAAQLVRDYDWSVLVPELVATISVGVAIDSGSGDIDEVLRAADRQLYRAKESGRDRVAADRAG